MPNKRKNVVREWKVNENAQLNGSCLQMENSNENGRHADVMWVNIQIVYLFLSQPLDVVSSWCKYFCRIIKNVIIKF